MATLMMKQMAQNPFLERGTTGFLSQILPQSLINTKNQVGIILSQEDSKTQTIRVAIQIQVLVQIQAAQNPQQIQVAQSPPQIQCLVLASRWASIFQGTWRGTSLVLLTTTQTTAVTQQALDGPQMMVLLITQRIMKRPEAALFIVIGNVVPKTIIQRMVTALIHNLIGLIITMVHNPAMLGLMTGRIILNAVVTQKMIGLVITRTIFLNPQHHMITQKNILTTTISMVMMIISQKPI